MPRPRFSFVGGNWFSVRYPSSIGDEDVHPAAVADVVDVLELSWLLAGLAVVAAWYGSKFLTDRLRPRLEERVLRPTTANAVLLIVRIGIVCYAFVPFAGLLGFRPQNVLLSFTVLSLVLGRCSRRSAGATSAGCSSSSTAPTRSAT